MSLSLMLQTSLKKSDLQFAYPEELVATERHSPSRVMRVRGDFPAVEISIPEFLQELGPGDLLVLNNTEVLRRRVFAMDQSEILFLKSNADKTEWEVLFPAKKYKVGQNLELPLEITATIVQKGRPQILKTSKPLTEDYFDQVGELPLPPYIQKARGERHNRDQDPREYQTVWAREKGSFAAPTASLHFTQADLADLSARGVQVVYLTLHVGLGTFLPVESEDLSQHKMHSEFVAIPQTTQLAIQKCKQRGGKVTALGTTVTRALESWALQGGLEKESRQDFLAWTDLLILPGFKFKVVDLLATNFHQPESTLLALVYAFSGSQKVRECYQWAIQHRFRLFSYGDLSVWSK